MSTESGEIPQSAALAEASVESLSDLMSRDPEGFSKQDIQRIIEVQRSARAKWEKMEAEEAASGKGKKERTKADTQQLLKKASGNAEDLGL